MYGYEVHFDGRPVKLPLAKGAKMPLFKDSLQAEAAARLAEHKLAQGAVPSVSRQEMDSLGIASQ